MIFEKLRIDRISKENKRAGQIIFDEDSIEMSIKGKDEWTGIKIKSEFHKNDIYLIQFDCDSQVEGMALTASASQNGQWVKEKVFTLAKDNKKYEFLFTPFDSDEIMLVITSYGKYPPGKMRISNLKMSNLFPIENKDDLKEKIEIMNPWYHNFDFDGIETRGKEKTHTEKQSGNGLQNFYQITFQEKRF